MEPTESKHFDLEYEMMNCVWFRNKVRESETYAQNLYAAMCNNQFVKNDVWPILEDKRGGCSWRYAGGIVADMREEGDYIDWYCSGIRKNITDEEFNELTEDRKLRYLTIQAYVSEGLVTDEIREDLFKLGWLVVDDELDDV